MKATTFEWQKWEIKDKDELSEIDGMTIDQAGSAYMKLWCSMQGLAPTTYASHKFSIRPKRSNDEWMKYYGLQEMHVVHRARPCIP